MNTFSQAENRILKIRALDFSSPKFSRQHRYGLLNLGIWGTSDTQFEPHRVTTRFLLSNSNVVQDQRLRSISSPSFPSLLLYSQPGGLNFWNRPSAPSLHSFYARRFVVFSERTAHPPSRPVVKHQGPCDFESLPGRAASCSPKAS